MQVKIEEAPEKARPKCPHCQATLDTVWVMKKGLGFVQQSQILLCPKCESILGYGSFAR